MMHLLKKNCHSIKLLHNGVKGAVTVAETAVAAEELGFLAEIAGGE